MLRDAEVKRSEALLRVAMLDYAETLVRIGKKFKKPGYFVEAEKFLELAKKFK